MFQAESTSVTLLTKPAGTTPTTPLAPCVIVTATRIDTLLSNTGSFSGSCTGILTGTASYASMANSSSYALVATSASYALTSSYSNTSTSASYALNTTTSSYALTATSASYSLNTISASHASTASYVNTLRQTVLISGSLIVSGSGSSSPLFNVVGSVEDILTIYDGDTNSGSIFFVNDSNDAPIFQVFTGSISMHKPTTISGSLNITGSALITGSLTIKDILVLTPRTTTPTPTEGMIIASGSAGSSILYYYNGTSWNALF